MPKPLPSSYTLASWVHPYLVVHLLRAVEHIDHDAQGSAQVLGCLRLACACRSCWSPTHGQVQGLGESDVAPVKYRRTEVISELQGHCRVPGRGRSKPSEAYKDSVKKSVVCSYRLLLTDTKSFLEGNLVTLILKGHQICARPMVILVLSTPLASLLTPELCSTLISTHLELPSLASYTRAVLGPLSPPLPAPTPPRMIPLFSLCLVSH